MRFIKKFGWKQNKYTKLFASWRNPQIAEVKSQHTGTFQSWAIQMHLSKRTANVSEGVCGGMSFFILKMLYMQETQGGVDRARFFMSEFQNPLISHDGISYRLNPLLESFSIVLFLSDETTLNDTTELLQALEKHNIWKNRLFLLLPELQSRGIETNLSLAAFVLTPYFRSRSTTMPGSLPSAEPDELKRLIDMATQLPNYPYSFWFFIEHFSKIATKRGILFPFVSEIMDIQERNFSSTGGIATTK